MDWPLLKHLWGRGRRAEHPQAGRQLDGRAVGGAVLSTLKPIARRHWSGCNAWLSVLWISTCLSTSASPDCNGTCGEAIRKRGRRGEHLHASERMQGRRGEHLHASERMRGRRAEHLHASERIPRLTAP
jgi:hypothetical protein